MAYYLAGDYYRAQGDFFGAIGGAISKVAKIGANVAGAIVNPLGAAKNVIGGFVSGGSAQQYPPYPGAVIPTPGVQGFVQRTLPGGQSGYQCAAGNVCGSGYHVDKATRTKCVRNRRRNYANPRALARATDRVDGFVKLARKAMTHTKYKVVANTYKHNWRKPRKT